MSSSQTATVGCSDHERPARKLRSDLPGVLLHQEGPVLIVTLNRPDSLNALTIGLLGSLRSVAQLAATDESVATVVLTGAGRGFCAGADLRERRPAGLSSEELQRDHYNVTIEALARLDKPIVAAVNGPVAGAGLGLACLADVRIVSSNARFVPAFSRLGVAPDFGVSFFVPRVLGYPRAAEWLMSNRELDAALALSWGLVNRVVTPELLMDAALGQAREFAALPATALRMTKTLLQTSIGRTLDEQLEAEVVAQQTALAAPEREPARAQVAAALEGRVAARPGGGA